MRDVTNDERDLERLKSVIRLWTSVTAKASCTEM